MSSSSFYALRLRRVLLIVGALVTVGVLVLGALVTVGALVLGAFMEKCP